MLSDNDATCGYCFGLSLRMYESLLHQRKIQRKTTTHTRTTLESYRFDCKWFLPLVKIFCSWKIHYLMN